MSKFLTKNFDFRGHLSTFQAENKPKNRSFNVQNNVYTLPKQLQKNFEKVQNTTFWTPKWPNHGCQLGKKCRFLSPFSIYENLFCLNDTNNLKKIDPPNSETHFFLQLKLRHQKIHR